MEKTMKKAVVEGVMVCFFNLKISKLCFIFLSDNFSYFFLFRCSFDFDWLVANQFTAGRGFKFGGRGRVRCILLKVSFLFLSILRGQLDWNSFSTSSLFFRFNAG